MPIKFKPIFTITPDIASNLLRIETARNNVLHLPLTPRVMSTLRETAQLMTTHYSTMIEGNALTEQQVAEIVKHQGHFPGREREEAEVKGYYTALQYIEHLCHRATKLTETILQNIHALVVGKGSRKVKATPYRDGQNVIRDSATRKIVYLPPEAADVASLMKALVTWTKTSELPGPLIAAIAHYQFATIHPYYDGNGRTARLLATLILHQHGYDLKGLYSLEEYYARNLTEYYNALSTGPSHNYYMGRAEADITSWIAYFIKGMALACENVVKRMEQAHNRGEIDSPLLRKLDPQQRKVLELFQNHDTVTSQDIGKLFGYKPRTASGLCKKWVDEGFLEITHTAKKNRKYRLTIPYSNF